ncbi:hypothetical protein SAMN05216489_06750 [Streptomyces sp. 3213]|uniref:hypothetical protein n=1 Tax=Streptomyces sp. 3213.3 TaxID=1855348 RepID=UPI0008966AFE|nr:hypothetical protein [Streptomyces sp. 3213.3]SEE47216.1 hypothetical protein SAMN05216489_06750 [Streptomyces sp. 3213] [Streptomyces sp. 3213.3]
MRAEQAHDPMEQLPENVDREILEQRIISALATVREALGCTLHQALDVFAERYEELRRDRPVRARPDAWGCSPPTVGEP